MSFKVGDTVIIKTTATRYVTGESIWSGAKNRPSTVAQVSGSEILIKYNKTYIGWCYENDIQLYSGSTLQVTTQEEKVIKSYSGLKQYSSAPQDIGSEIYDYVHDIHIPLNVSPESISESVTAQYNTQAIAGRSAPIYTYEGTNARKISFSINIAEDIVPSEYVSLIDYLNTLKSLCYPKYGSNGNVVPPKQSIVLCNGLSAIGAIDSVSNTYNTVYRDGRLIHCRVDLSFVEMMESCKGATTIRNGG